MTTMKALALAVGLLTSALAAPFDYDRYDREDVEKFKVSTYYKHLKASYQHEGTKSGDAMLNRKSVTIVWEWKDGVCTSVSEYFMNDRGEYDFASTTKCSFEQGDVMDVAELFFNEDGVESFAKKYGKEAKEDVAEGQVAEIDVKAFEKEYYRSTGKQRKGQLAAKAAKYRKSLKKDVNERATKDIFGRDVKDEVINDTVTAADIIRMATDSTEMIEYEEKYGIQQDTRTRVAIRCSPFPKPIRFLDGWAIVVGSSVLSKEDINTHKRFGGGWTEIHVHLTFKDEAQATTFYNAVKRAGGFDVIGKLTNQLPGPGKATIVQIEGVLLEEVVKHNK